MKSFLLACAALAVVSAAPAHAGEVYAGIYAHEVDTPFTLKTYEDGVDTVVGARTEPLAALGAIGKPSVHAFASINSAGDTSFGAVGLNWKLGLGGPIYVRPGIGLALHNGPELRLNPDETKRTDFGSRVLFEPELALGVSLGNRASLEASWIHISNARILDSQQNPGLDIMGLRAGYRF